MKLCTHCGLTLQLSEFHRQTRAKDGLTPHCKGCNRLRVQRWREANPVRAAARRARKKGCPPELRMTAGEWSAIKAYFKGRCAYCLAESESLQIEHMVPLSRGGWHVASNVVPACAACNRSKGARTSVEFMGAVA